MNSDDPKFTAHVLGECEDLTAAERAEIEALLFGDPAASAEAAETRALAARLRAELPGEAAAALEEGQRAAVLRAAGSAAPVARVVPFPRRTTALAAIAASLVAGVTLALAFRQLRDVPAGNLPVLTRNLSENPATMAASNVSSPKAITPSVAASVPAQPVQFGNITVAQSNNDHIFKPSIELPSAPQLEAMLVNCSTSNNGATVVDAGAINGGSNNFVNTTTMLNYSVVGQSVSQVVNNQFDSGVARLGAQPVIAVTSTIQTNSSGSFTFYTGSTVIVGNVAANSTVEPSVIESTGGNRPVGLLVAGVSDPGNVNQTSAGRSVMGTVPGATAVSLLATTNEGFLNARENPVSTFGFDVGTASYVNVRRILEGHRRPPPDAVRTEELLNHFTYDYPPPLGDARFSTTTEVAECPWAPEHRLVRIGLKGREIPGARTVIAREVTAEVEFNPEQVGAYRLIGYEPRALGKTDLIRSRKSAADFRAGQAVTALYEVVPAGKELPPFAMLDKSKRQQMPREKVVQPLSEAALRGAETKAPTATTSTAAPKPNAAPSRATPKWLIVPAPAPDAESEARPATPQLLPSHEPKPLPEAEPAPRDARAELLPPHVPSAESARHLQPEPKPPEVKPYLVEQEPRNLVVKGPTSRELLRLSLHYKAPEGGASKLLVFPLTDSGTTWEKSSPDFRFAAAVAGYGMLLRDSTDRGQATWQSVAAWAREGLGPDANGSRAEFLDLIEKAKALSP